jgi:hypothetical protein
VYFLQVVGTIGAMLGIVFVLSAGVFGSWAGAWRYLKTLIALLLVMVAAGAVSTLIVWPLT